MAEAVRYILDANVLIEAKRRYYAFDLCPGFFVPTETALVSAAYRDINKWVQSQDRFSNFEKSRFADDVDAWIIAYAKANNATVVTHEAPAPRSSKIKIPDVCDYFDIKHVNTFEMLVNLGVVFNWVAN